MFSNILRNLNHFKNSITIFNIVSEDYSIMSKKIIFIKNITILTMSILYISIGIKHFTHPDFFIAIVPKLITWKKEAVLISGIFEIALGLLLLFKKTRKFAAYGIILLLIAVFPANIYLFISEIAREKINISKSQALIRMPFQIPLIIIAYWHSKKNQSSQFSIACIVLFLITIIYFLTI